MGQRRKGSVKELVTIAYAEDYELAKHYKDILNDNGIFTEIKRQSKDCPGYPHVAVMVPEDLIDDACSLITEQMSLYDNIFKMGYDFDDSQDSEEYSEEY